MTRRGGLWSGLLVAAVLCSVSLRAGDLRATGDGQATSNNASLGNYLFKTYCASCHGTTGRGDGPLAASMTRRPANLTEIAKRNKGTYPSELVYKVIDGRTKVPGHGGPDMPVWGDAFMRTAENLTEESLKHRIQALVDYLETIQARDTQN